MLKNRIQDLIDAKWLKITSVGAQWESKSSPEHFGYRREQCQHDWRRNFNDTDRQDKDADVAYLPLSRRGRIC